MYERQAFVDRLYAFLDYTEPDNLRDNIKEPDNPVEDVAYRFALKLYGYACTSFDAKMRNVFGIAAEFIDKEVIGLFRTEDGVYP